MLLVHHRRRGTGNTRTLRAAGKLQELTHEMDRYRGNILGQKLKTVTRVKYGGPIISDEGSEPEIVSRVAQTTAALTRLKSI